MSAVIEHGGYFTSLEALSVTVSAAVMRWKSGTQDSSSCQYTASWQKALRHHLGDGS